MGLEELNTSSVVWALENKLSKISEKDKNGMLNFFIRI
jgi:hypothetical protein